MAGFFFISDKITTASQFTDFNLFKLDILIPPIGIKCWILVFKRLNLITPRKSFLFKYDVLNNLE